MLVIYYAFALVENEGEEAHSQRKQNAKSSFQVQLDKMQNRVKRHRNSTHLSQRSQLYLDSTEASNRQYKIFGAISAFSIFLLLILYKIGLFTRTPSTYIAGSATQKFEESRNALLSAWGQTGEALKFANLPSLGQGYLTVTAMVVQQGINTNA